MVFSHSNATAKSVLKVVDIDRLKPGKSPQVKHARAPAETQAQDAAPRTPCDALPSEEYLKSEPLFESAMYRDTDGEFFQDLGLWCSDPAKEETTITEPLDKTAERAYTADTPHTPFSELGWEALDVQSPAGPLGPLAAPADALSPALGGLLGFDYRAPDHQYMSQQFLDIRSLPVVFGDLPPAEAPQPEPLWAEHLASTHTLPFIHQEDSLEPDMKYITWAQTELSAQPGDNDVVVSDFIIDDKRRALAPPPDAWAPPARAALSLDVAARPTFHDIINTPDLLSCVEQLENEKFGPLNILDTDLPGEQSLGESSFISMDAYSTSTDLSKVEFEPITPKMESPAESSCEEEPPPRKRRRRDSEDSDETYTPHVEKLSPRKYKRRKPSVPIKDLILALEDTQQQTRVRRGRPPKRRESTVSSLGSVDDAPGGSHQGKYRELRDKNNEASKRSRMNRKLKELQMEHQAVELERSNKQLLIKADILEDLTKRLKEALMRAMLNK